MGWSLLRKEVTMCHSDLIHYLPFDYVVSSWSMENDFFRFLREKCRVSTAELERLLCCYLIGSTRDGGIIYWQLDFNGNVRTGKVMYYDANSGHRIKTGMAVDWIHSRLKRKGLLPEDFAITQCLFGEHLLHSDDIGKAVALVESEKTALLGSLVFPDYVWVAVGGKANFKPERMVALCNRTVIIFPDVDAYDEWKEKSRRFFLPKRVIVCDLLERQSSATERGAKIDIGDWLIASLIERANFS